MKLSSVEQAEQAKYLLLTELQEHQTPMSLQELGLNLSESTRSTGSTKLSHRTLKEAAWRLVEEGKAKFNATWDLEIL
ncbi:MAG: hypothetical protein WBM44_21765 [Waterburya sp.]